ncbi:DnaA N-terminal domain-containing protein [Viridibacillus arvi]|uniref:DnaA N-terminal domain-containing protein n=1 Tax=Viridibacillus arvi TaxID=263475 RepID=UPI0034D0135B
MEKNDLYVGYNSKRYAHYRNIKTGEHESQLVKSAKVGQRLKPIIKKVKVPFEEVKKLRLDSEMYGSVVPALDTEDFTIVSNYLVDFWGAIMGDSAISAYLHLKRHAYGKKDYCYIDIDLIALKMSRSRNTVKGYLDTLEQHGFIAVFLRKDVEDNNRDVSPLFKIRRYVPLITEEMYESLHPKLQKLHDEFMDELNGVGFNTKLLKTDDVIDEIVNEGEVINNKEVREKIEQVIKEGQLEEYILQKLDLEQLDINDRFHDSISKKISKPSYETWFKKSIIVMEDEFNATILAPNKFNKEWLDNHYGEMIKNWAIEEFGTEMTIGSINYELMNDYIETKLRRVV